MDTSDTSVRTSVDGTTRTIVVTLHGVPVVIPVYRPERYAVALHDAQSIAAQVLHGDMFWSDGVRHLIRFSAYYSAPLPHPVQHDWSLHHLAHVGKATLHAPAAVAHYVKEHLPHQHPH